tara:strand:+ start:165 stop:689 length:525 start_codon:yes stop_codon:yes gene_type:complete
MHTKTIIITNVHFNGFCFAYDIESAEGVFIPAGVVDDHDVKAGDSINAVLIPNYSDKASSTPWMAIKIENGVKFPQPETTGDVIKLPEPEPEPISPQKLDKAVFAYISETKYCTTSEIAEHLNIDSKTIGNSAQRNFNAGRIARASVHNRVGMAKPSFILWAMNASDFVDISYE